MKFLPRLMLSSGLAAAAFAQAFECLAPSLPRGGETGNTFAAGMGKHAGPGRGNAPDMREVSHRGLTDAEVRAHFSMGRMIAAPFVAGSAGRQLSPEIRDTLTSRDATAIARHAAGERRRSAPIAG